MPTGTVVFNDGMNVLGSAVLTNGVTTYTTSSLSSGPHSIFISYSGDSVYGASTSTAQIVTVNLTTPAIALTVPASAGIGSPVTLTVKVTGTGGTPTGVVIFKDGATTLSTVTLTNGSATYTASSLAAGTKMITAAYSGDSTFAAAVLSAQTVTMNLLTPTVTLTAPASVMSRASVTLSATVAATGGSPTGTVAFMAWDMTRPIPR